jgi:hypothetical protein
MKALHQYRKKLVNNQTISRQSDPRNAIWDFKYIPNNPKICKLVDLL